MTSILSDIDVNVESRKVKDLHRIGKSNNGSEKTIIRFTNRKHYKQALLNWKCLEMLNYSKHQFGSSTKVFINENLTIRNEQPAFSCRQLKRKKQVFATFTKNDMVYIKHNENSRPVLVADITILQDMFPEFYVCDETRENQNIRILKCITILIRAA